jgi:hypothetical protein
MSPNGWPIAGVWKIAAERQRHFVLNPRTLKPVGVDMMTWAHAFQEVERHLAVTHFFLPTGDALAVSTVFLGLEHGWPGRSKWSRLWETMTFGPIDLGDDIGQLQLRYRTAVQAMKGHRHAVWLVRRQLLRAGVSPRRVTQRFRTGE